MENKREQCREKYTRVIHQFRQMLMLIRKLEAHGSESTLQCVAKLNSSLDIQREKLKCFEDPEAVGQHSAMVFKTEKNYQSCLEAVFGLIASLKEQVLRVTAERLENQDVPVDGDMNNIAQVLLADIKQLLLTIIQVECLDQTVGFSELHQNLSDYLKELQHYYEDHLQHSHNELYLKLPFQELLRQLASQVEQVGRYASNNLPILEHECQAIDAMVSVVKKELSDKAAALIGSHESMMQKDPIHWDAKAAAETLMDNSSSPVRPKLTLDKHLKLTRLVDLIKHQEDLTQVRVLEELVNSYLVRFGAEQKGYRFRGDVLGQQQNEHLAPCLALMKKLDPVILSNLGKLCKFTFEADFAADGVERLRSASSEVKTLLNDCLHPHLPTWQRSLRNYGFLSASAQTAFEAKFEVVGSSQGQYLQKLWRSLERLIESYGALTAADKSKATKSDNTPAGLPSSLEPSLAFIESKDVIVVTQALHALSPALRSFLFQLLPMGVSPTSAFQQRHFSEDRGQSVVLFGLINLDFKSALDATRHKAWFGYFGGDPALVERIKKADERVAMIRGLLDPQACQQETSWVKDMLTYDLAVDDSNQSHLSSALLTPKAKVNQQLITYTAERVECQVLHSREVDWLIAAGEDGWQALGERCSFDFKTQLLDNLLEKNIDVFRCQFLIDVMLPALGEALDQRNMALANQTAIETTILMKEMNPLLLLFLRPIILAHTAEGSMEQRALRWLTNDNKVFQRLTQVESALTSDRAMHQFRDSCFENVDIFFDHASSAFMLAKFNREEKKTEPSDFQFAGEMCALFTDKVFSAALLHTNSAETKVADEKTETPIKVGGADIEVAQEQTDSVTTPEKFSHALEKLVRCHPILFSLSQVDETLKDTQAMQLMISGLHEMLQGALQDYQSRLAAQVKVLPVSEPTLGASSDSLLI